MDMLREPEGEARAMSLCPGMGLVTCIWGSWLRAAPCPSQSKRRKEHVEHPLV